MRILEGKWGGRVLTSPSGRVRPTAETVRFVLFPFIGVPPKGLRVLDLFAGTGAVGLEFLSRGASRCDFVESGGSAIHALKANVAKLRIPKGKVRVFVRDAIPWVEALPVGSYDVAYADPPWGSKKLDRVVETWMARPFSRILILEHPVDAILPPLPEGARSRVVGDAVLTLIEAPAGSEAPVESQSQAETETPATP